MDTLRILLPVGWAVIATVISLVLYRVSTTRFETKWLTISGSSVVGILAFAAMFAATRSLLEPDRGAVVLDAGRADALDALCSELSQNAANAEKFCVDEGKNQFMCMQALKQVRSTSLQLTDLVTETRESKDP